MDEQPSYWEKSQRLREAFARHVLVNVLNWAFAFADEILASREDELDDFIYNVRDHVGGVEPAWKPAMEELRNVPGNDLRGDLAEAFAKIRTIAHDVATKEITDAAHITVEVYIPPGDQDRDGKPRFIMRGRLADALIWTTLKLFSEVPRSLIRTCAFTGCSSVYVASKNQKYCHPHHMEAARQTQRRAERAFRARQRTKKGRKA